ncbi:hypothetical protein FRB96_007792 [Tulasnella sp. 330]|nr:hypothetical protein FRB96_007792 [Tulasnella sp. 330]
MTLFQLRALDIPHEVVELDFHTTVERIESPELKRLLAVNPLAQFPTLVTPEGAIMTETAGIVLYLNERHGRNTPWGTSSPDPARLASFYRWIVFLPTNVMTTVTQVEFPTRFITIPENASVNHGVVESWVAEAGKTRRGDVWHVLEEHLGEAMNREEGKPFLLGTEHPNMLDAYVTLLAHWTNHPRKTIAASSLLRESFEENDCDAFMGKETHSKMLDNIP